MTTVDSADVLLKMKTKIEIFQSALMEIKYSKLTTDNSTPIFYNDKINVIVDAYNQFFNTEFVNLLLDDIKSINDKINDVLDEECNHDIQEDMIDITPDSSQKIYYCKKCYLTLK
jgi:hypothetical protein